MERVKPSVETIKSMVKLDFLIYVLGIIALIIHIITRGCTVNDYMLVCSTASLGFASGLSLGTYAFTKYIYEEKKVGEQDAQT